MTASLNPYSDKYQQACKAYVQKDYDRAVALIDEVVENLPDDPNSHLLRGHIYYVLNKYEIAKAEYQNVFDLTEDLEIISCAKEGLDNITKFQDISGDISEDISRENFTTDDSEASINLYSSLSESSESELEKIGATEESGDNLFDLNSWSDFSGTQGSGMQGEMTNPFETSMGDAEFNGIPDQNDNFIDPFSVTPQTTESSNLDNKDNSVNLEIPPFLQEHQNVEASDILSNTPENSHPENSVKQKYSYGTGNLNDSPFTEVDSPKNNHLNKQSGVLNNEFVKETKNKVVEFKNQNSEDETLLMAANISKIEQPIANDLKSSTLDRSSQSVRETDVDDEISNLEDISLDDSLLQTSSTTSSLNFNEQQSQSLALDGDNSFDLEAFESAFASQDDGEDTDTILDGNLSQNSNIEFLDDFEEFDDLGDIPGFDMADNSAFRDSQVSSGYLDTDSNTSSKQVLEAKKTERNSTKDTAGANSEPELFSVNSAQEAVPIFTPTDINHTEPQVNVEQGVLAPLENASLRKKQWLVAGTVGTVSMIVVAAVTYLASNFTPPQQRESVRNTGWAMALAAGVSGAVTTGFMSSLTMRQVRRTTQDLQNQFNAVRQGNLNVQATVYSEDELGQLAAGFNEMARVIFTTTNEATRKAQEQEEAKENLQRQVIRLLDDVEGAARGDLTVQAEVTADVLGAVADAFNLTIQNLRDIVQQVKVAAREVTKGATNSETFARALSSDALRQAEELAVTLNSVQVMTDSIQRVAEAAREAEAVARDASEIALKGGEAVENTVAGILEIRETVAETTRKVKRLAESSQEISKIVALISQIASRTNLLALNASIEAARAGDAGRGFAIVADEVRQLADKSAKSLKEIEQIVLQIQSETGSVMTAMEEGTQQVIKGTKLAEEAKRSLENIIQTANRIDTLVRSITADTVEQTDTSRAVAQVMQSVELTAQETSQEAQRVSGALQHLVGVSRDLIASVERFRVETVESK